MLKFDIFPYVDNGASEKPIQNNKTYLSHAGGMALYVGPFDNLGYNRETVNQ